MYICSFPIIYVGKYIIEQNIMFEEISLAWQKWPVTSQVVYRNSSKLRISLQLAVSSVLIYFKNSFSVPSTEFTDVWWPTTAIRQNDINLLILDLNLNYFVLKIKQK